MEDENMKWKHKITLLLILACCISNLAWSTAVGAKTFYGKVTAISQPDRAGVVYVSRPTQDAIDLSTSVENANTVKQKVVTEGKTPDVVIIDRDRENVSWVKDADIQFYFCALPKDGYRFVKWTCGDYTLKNPTDNPASNTVTTNSRDASGSFSMGTYYANFVASKVDRVVSVNNVSVAGNPYGVSGVETVVFAVSNADEIADFTGSISGEGFAFANGTYENSATFANNQITISYKFTAYNVAGECKGEITLTSKGFDDGSTNSTKSAYLAATADFTPQFTITDYNYNSDNEVLAGSPITNGKGTLNPTKSNKAAEAQTAVDSKNGTIWSVWLTDDTQNAFTISGVADGQGKYHPEGGNATVTLSPQNAGAYSAKLHIVCTYFDKHDAPAESEEKVITLSATAVASQQSKLTFNDQDGYAHTFADTYCGERIENTIPLRVENVSDLSGAIQGDAHNVFAYRLESGQVTVSVLSSTPGDYSATLVVSGKNALAGHESEVTSATMAMSAKVRLRTPDLVVLTGHSQNTLQWQPVVGATKYVLKVGDTQLATLAADATEYVHTGLTVGQSYTYTLTAVYEPDEQYNTSATITASTGVITAASAANTGLQTGTEHPTSNTFPYKVKRNVDLTGAFANGKAACDLLYIFGVTTNTDGATAVVGGVTYHKVTTPTADNPSKNIVGTASNAKTPCYIYQKDGDNYRYKETIDNMNVASKPSQFNFTANGQKIYFTGYCPVASCGSTKNEDGVVFVQGGENNKIDFYLDDLQMYARMKRADGHAGNADTVQISLGFTMYVLGSGADFVFQSSSESSAAPFMPSIHVRGDNTLKSTQGNVVYVNAVIKELTAGQYSAPLHILVTDKSQCTNLSIDDIWYSTNLDGIEHINGSLRLVQAASNAPSVDLGNANSTLNIGGGQIYFKNAVPASTQYKTALAVSYRTYQQEAKILGVTATATMYGIGNDQAGGTINFNDGSIHCTPLDAKTVGNYGSYYRDYTSMKCPKNTRINGGTYSCRIWACESAASLGASPTNQYNDSLNMIGFAVDKSSSPYNLVSPISFPDKYKYKNQTLAQYYMNHTAYGQNSITANANDSVYYMLPSDEVVQDVTMQPWALCIPALRAGASGYNQSLGGDIFVQSDATIKTSRLLYGAIDTYLRDKALDGYKSPELSATIDMSDNDLHKQVVNTADYSIEDKLYMLLPVVADQWQMFVAPFDISKVSIIESYPEDTVVKYNQDVEEARKIQSQRTMDLLYYCCEGIVMNKSQFDFDAFKNRWVNYTKKTYGYTPKIAELKHATDDNWFEANYYLYHSAGTWEYDGTNFVTDWQPAAAEKVTHGDTEHSVLMKQGEVYAFDFPYMVGENDHTKWDYWTGKFLLLEGYGPQTLHGSDYATEIVADYAVAGSAALRGNATFANVTVQKENAYYLWESDGENHNKYVKNAAISKDLEPGEGFLLANIPASKSPARAIAINTGIVTYDTENGTDAETGVPTIAGGHSLIVNSVAGGVEVIPVEAQQVSVYGAAGQLIVSDYLTDETTIALPAGIYIVRGEKEMVKVVVR